MLLLRHGYLAWASWQIPAPPHTIAFSAERRRADSFERIRVGSSDMDRCLAAAQASAEQPSRPSTHLHQQTADLVPISTILNPARLDSYASITAWPNLARRGTIMRFLRPNARVQRPLRTLKCNSTEPPERHRNPGERVGDEIDLRKGPGEGEYCLNGTRASPPLLASSARVRV